MPEPLIRPLFDGPLDVIGDVHGELDALRALLGHLGYDPATGAHPQGRRLVFLGDLTDRGPDSPGTAALVERFVGAGRAQCLLGNHELNVLLGLHKGGNGWFYGLLEALDRNGPMVPQALADEATRDRLRAFFRTLPLILERDDLRLVHACWDAAAVAQIRAADADVVTLYHRCRAAVDSQLLTAAVHDPVARGLAHQNANPVKLLTSGKEMRAPRPFYASGKMRDKARVAWWADYRDGPACVFGHYWRLPLAGAEESSDVLFDPRRLFTWLGPGRALCIDYSVGKRYRERLAGTGRAFVTRLAALRWPEAELAFDDGDRRPVEPAP
jgi:hypothetical protein